MTEDSLVMTKAAFVLTVGSLVMTVGSLVMTKAALVMTYVYRQSQEHRKLFVTQGSDRIRTGGPDGMEANGQQGNKGGRSHG